MGMIVAITEGRCLTKIVPAPNLAAEIGALVGGDARKAVLEWVVRDGQVVDLKVRFLPAAEPAKRAET